MYTAFYKMTAEPFPGRPSPEVFFKSQTHNQGMYFLLSGIKDQEAFLLVTGEYGMGKSLLCLRMARVLNKYRKYHYLYLSTPVYSYFEVLQRIAGACGYNPNWSENPESLQSNLLNYLEKNDHNPPLIIVVDDLQDYSEEVLIRMKYFADFNINGFYPFRFIFFSHPSFLERLEENRFQSLDQRIRRRYTLTSFNFWNTKEYIFFRLLVSGAKGVPFFPDEAIQKIFEHSRGVPRLINNICDTCLLMGASNQAEIIDTSIVAQSLDYLSKQKRTQPRFSQTTQDIPADGPAEPAAPAEKLQKDLKKAEAKVLDFTSIQNQKIEKDGQNSETGSQKRNADEEDRGGSAKLSPKTQKAVVLLLAVLVFFLGLFFRKDLFGFGFSPSGSGYQIELESNQGLPVQTNNVTGKTRMERKVTFASDLERDTDTILVFEAKVDCPEILTTEF